MAQRCHTMGSVKVWADVAHAFPDVGAGDRTRIAAPGMSTGKANGTRNNRKTGARLEVSALVLLFVLAMMGCEALSGSTKVDNPVFGPPPPRSNHIESATDAKITDAKADEPKPADPKAGDAQPNDTKTNAAKTADAQSVEAKDADPKALDDLKTAEKTAKTKSDSEPSAVKPTSFVERDASKKMLTGYEVIATVNDHPIFASEIFDRAATDRLGPDGIPYLIARKSVEAKLMSEEEFRQLQEIAIRRYLKEYIKTRLLSQTLMATVDADQNKKIEAAMKTMYEEHIERLKKQMNVNTQTEVDANLATQGTSLDSLFYEFKTQILAMEYLRTKSKKPRVVGRLEILAYYNEHSKEFTTPEQVRWQLLQVSFAKHGGRKKALKTLQKAILELGKGKSFDAVVRKYSDGPRADKGGRHPWTNPHSMVDEKTAKTLCELRKGDVSPVLETEETFRLVRLLDHRPAGRKPLAEVQESIKETIDDKFQKEATKKVLDDLYRQATIESPYLPPEKDRART
jgi:parvulin-like peptidyl-prolyl isomerase